MNSVWVAAQNGVHQHNAVDEVGTHDTSSLPEELQAITSAGSLLGEGSPALQQCSHQRAPLAQVKDPSIRLQVSNPS